jgi:hypothetical protein
MDQRPQGTTRLTASVIGRGASPLGGVYNTTEKTDQIQTGKTNNPTPITSIEDR